MSGIEVAGIVLGTIPLLVSALEKYEIVVQSVSKYRKFSSKVRTLHDALCLERTIFRAECVLLLAPDISKAQAERMLDDPAHPSWRDETFGNRMDRCFGSLGYAMSEVIKSIVVALSSISVTIKLLAQNTDEPSLGTQQSEPGWRSSVRTKLKFALSSQSVISKDLADLTKMNERFTMLSSQIRQLEQFWSPPTTAENQKSRNEQHLQKLLMARTAFIELHHTFVQSCPVEHDHFLRFGLNDVGAHRNVAGTDGAITFQIHHCNARTGDTGDFTEANMSQKTRDTADVTSEHRLRIESKIPADVDDGRAPESASVQSESESLCLRLSMMELRSPKSGSVPKILSLGHEGFFEHLILSSTSVPTSLQTTSLADLLSHIKIQGRHFEIPQYQRLHLARMLGTAVLQLYGSPWFARSLNSKRLYLLGESGDVAEITHYGYTDIEPDTLYMDIELKPGTARPPEATTALIEDTVSAPLQSRFGLRSSSPNSWLYHLGILMIELAYHTPFVDLVKELKDEYIALSIPLSSDVSVAEYQIACQLADNVGATLGADYSKIVRQCLRCEFGVRSSDLSNQDLQCAVYENVVRKLKYLEDAFKKLQIESTA